MNFVGSNLRVVSSAVEHRPHTSGVTGSNPVQPTIIEKLGGNLGGLGSKICRTH